MPVDTTLIEALLVPVPGDNPAGAELRYDPRYDQVKEARREDPDLPRGPQEGPRKLSDWPAVVKLSRELIEKESKDLQLAAWLTEALLNRDGLTGLATGVRVMHGILDTYLGRLLPAVGRGRSRTARRPARVGRARASTFPSSSSPSRLTGRRSSTTRSPARFPPRPKSKGTRRSASNATSRSAKGSPPPKGWTRRSPRRGRRSTRRW